MSAQMDGWANFADYLSLNKDASQRQLQGVLDEQAPNAEMIRSNAQRQFANAGQLGFEGNDINQGHGGEQEKLMMDYGQFVEGLSDPSRLQAYFAKHGAGGNSALDAGLASVAGAGQIQEAQKGLTALQNYVTEKGVDAQTRYEGGQQARAQANAQEAQRQKYNASWKNIDQTNSADQAKFAADRQRADETFADARRGTSDYRQRMAEFDPTGARFKGQSNQQPARNSLGMTNAGRIAVADPFPSWARKPGGF